MWVFTLSTWALLFSSLPLVICSYLWLLLLRFVFVAKQVDHYRSLAQIEQQLQHCEALIRRASLLHPMLIGFVTFHQPQGTLLFRHDSDQLQSVNFLFRRWFIVLQLRKRGYVLVWRDSTSEAHYRHFMVVLRGWQQGRSELKS